MIRLATIGTNFITDWFMEGVQELEEIKLVAVYSRSLQKGKAFAAKYHVDKVYDNYEEMAQDSEIDAVYIASPTYMHYAHSITMINYGKHVLCEKPVCSNKEELDLLIHAAKENNVVFMEAMKNIHSPGFQAMKDHLHKLGTIRRATIQYCQYSSRYDKFKNGIVENAFNPKLSNGALMDIGSYAVHFLAALFGRPKKILSDSIFLENGVDGAGSILASYGDKQAEVIYSKITNSKLPTQIQGEDGCMVIEECPILKKITIYGRDGSMEELSFDFRDNPMIYETKDFIRLIKEGNIDHEFLPWSEMEMEILDEVRRQNHIVFPADKIREQ